MRANQRNFCAMTPVFRTDHYQTVVRFFDEYIKPSNNLHFLPIANLYRLSVVTYTNCIAAGTNQENLVGQITNIFQGFFVILHFFYQGFITTEDFEVDQTLFTNISSE